ncbi:Hypothetical_protein [Hexamita inflata]|uniref:Hypothetical_protein n=1 Tax=Hexamita inflata TaxID=28002 RepID=A0AA86U3N2_9EUKA|nr:Hypothetical protein HINF_LOCUS27014 [Hexamita inflata]
MQEKLTQTILLKIGIIQRQLQLSNSEISIVYQILIQNSEFLEQYYARLQSLLQNKIKAEYYQQLVKISASKVKQILDSVKNSKSTLFSQLLYLRTTWIESITLYIERYQLLSYPTNQSIVKAQFLTLNSILNPLDVIDLGKIQQISGLSFPAIDFVSFMLSTEWEDNFWKLQLKAADSSISLKLFQQLVMQEHQAITQLKNHLSIPIFSNGIEQMPAQFIEQVSDSQFDVRTQAMNLMRTLNLQIAEINYSRTLNNAQILSYFKKLQHFVRLRQNIQHLAEERSNLLQVLDQFVQSKKGKKLILFESLINLRNNTIELFHFIHQQHSLSRFYLTNLLTVEPIFAKILYTFKPEYLFLAVQLLNITDERFKSQILRGIEQVIFGSDAFWADILQFVVKTSENARFSEKNAEICTKWATEEQSCILDTVKLIQKCKSAGKGICSIPMSTDEIEIFTAEQYTYPEIDTQIIVQQKEMKSGGKNYKPVEFPQETLNTTKPKANKQKQENMDCIEDSTHKIVQTQMGHDEIFVSQHTNVLKLEDIEEIEGQKSIQTTLQSRFVKFRPVFDPQELIKTMQLNISNYQAQVQNQVNVIQKNKSKAKIAKIMNKSINKQGAADFYNKCVHATQLLLAAHNKRILLDILDSVRVNKQQQNLYIKTIDTSISTVKSAKKNSMKIQTFKLPLKDQTVQQLDLQCSIISKAKQKSLKNALNISKGDQLEQFTKQTETASKVILKAKRSSFNYNVFKCANTQQYNKQCQTASQVLHQKFKEAMKQKYQIKQVNEKELQNLSNIAKMIVKAKYSQLNRELGLKTKIDYKFMVENAQKLIIKQNKLKTVKDTVSQLNLSQKQNYLEIIQTSMNPLLKLNKQSIASKLITELKPSIKLDPQIKIINKLILSKKINSLLKYMKDSLTDYKTQVQHASTIILRQNRSQKFTDLITQLKNSKYLVQVEQTNILINKRINQQKINQIKSGIDQNAKKSYYEQINHLLVLILQKKMSSKLQKVSENITVDQECIQLLKLQSNILSKKVKQQKAVSLAKAMIAPTVLQEFITASQNQQKLLFKRVSKQKITRQIKQQFEAEIQSGMQKLGVISKLLVKANLIKNAKEMCDPQLIVEEKDKITRINSLFSKKQKQANALSLLKSIQVKDDIYKAYQDELKAKSAIVIKQYKRQNLDQYIQAFKQQTVNKKAYVTELKGYCLLITDKKNDKIDVQQVTLKSQIDLGPQKVQEPQKIPTQSKKEQILERVKRIAKAITFTETAQQQFFLTLNNSAHILTKNQAQQKYNAIKPAPKEENDDEYYYSDDEPEVIGK